MRVHVCARQACACCDGFEMNPAEATKQLNAETAIGRLEVMATIGTSFQDHWQALAEVSGTATSPTTSATSHPGLLLGSQGHLHEYVPEVPPEDGVRQSLRCQDGLQWLGGTGRCSCTGLWLVLGAGHPKVLGGSGQGPTAPGPARMPVGTTLNKGCLLVPAGTGRVRCRTAPVRIPQSRNWVGCC